MPLLWSPDRGGLVTLFVLVFVLGLHGIGFFVAAVSAVGIPAVLASRLGQGAAGYGLVLAAIGVGALAGNLIIGNVQAARWLPTYCCAWGVTGIALIGYSAAPSLPVMIGFGLLSGLATPAAAVTLRARLADFEGPERLWLITVDQTVIRSAGTVGMLTLPLAIDAAPAVTFAGAGVFLAAAAIVSGLVARWAVASRAAKERVLAATRASS